MQLTDAQKQAVADALRAEPSLAANIAIGNHGPCVDWLNAESTTVAWKVTVDKGILTKVTINDATVFNKYDNLTVGKRDAWNLIMDVAKESPFDFRIVGNRELIGKIWTVTGEKVAILTACTEFARKGEEILGGSTDVTDTVSALSRNVIGTFNKTEVSQIMNNF